MGQDFFGYHIPEMTKRLKGIEKEIRQANFLKERELRMKEKEIQMKQHELAILKEQLFK